MAIVFSFIQSFAWVLGTGLGICIVALLFPLLRKGPDKHIGTLLLLSLLLSFWSGVAFLLQALWPPLPPIDTGHWVLWYLWPVGGFALFQNYFDIPFWLRALFRLFTGSTLVYLLSSPLREYSWTQGYAVLFIVCFTALYFFYAEALEFLSKKHNDSQAFHFPVLFALMSMASAWLFLLASTAVLQQQALFLVISLMVPLGLMLWRPKLQAHKGLVSISTHLLLGLWLQVWLFADANVWGLGVLALPFCLVCLNIPQLKKQSLHAQLLCWSSAVIYCLAVLFIVWQTTEQPQIYTG